VISRRAFSTLLGGAAAWPLAARAQQRERVRLIGVIMNYAEADPQGQVRLSALRARLRELGWVEGRNIQIESRWAEGQPDRMQAYGGQLVEMPVDVLVANSTPLLAVLKRLTLSIPIVFTQVADPISSGFLTNYARPDGNITGFTDFDATIAGKWMEVLKEAAPRVVRVTVLHDPNQKNHPAFLQVIESVASAFGVQVDAVAARDRNELEKSLLSLNGETDRGLIVLPGPVNNTRRNSIIEAAAKYRLPAIYPFKYYADDGGLLYYGTDQIDQWPKAAAYVDRILKGDKPADLPVQGPTKFELVINLKTAKALGLNIPDKLLALADEVIE
jgi:putative ABC transport system substrate-binding protein